MDLSVLLDNLGFFVEIILFMLIYQHITSERIKLRWYLIAPIILRVMFLVVPFLAFITSYCFLVGYSLFKNRYQNRLLDVFYGLFPIVIESIIFRLLVYCLALVLDVGHDVIVRNYILNFLIEVSVFPVFWLITKVLKVDFRALGYGFKKSFSKFFLICVDFSMIIYFIVLQCLIVIENNMSSDKDFRVYLVVTYAILFLAMLVYINGVFSEKLQEEVLLQKDKQIGDLARYSQQVEQLYSEVRHFRHDYLNVLSCIKYGIDHEDIQAISTIYNDVLAKSKRQIEGQQFEIANLINIKDEAIKGILTTKLLEAQNQSITMKIEIGEVFKLKNMDLLDFVTILSIFLDNAIEASLESHNPQVTVAFIAGEADMVVVENSIAQESVSSANIFKLGYSTKGENRGIGLSNVREILGKYPHCSLKTKSKDYRFSQTLIINK